MMMMIKKKKKKKEFLSEGGAYGAAQPSPWSVYLEMRIEEKPSSGLKLSSA